MTPVMPGSLDARQGDSAIRRDCWRRGNGDRVRAGADWSSTPLGPIGSWWKELITIVNLRIVVAVAGANHVGRGIHPDLQRCLPVVSRAIGIRRHRGNRQRIFTACRGRCVGPLLEGAFATGTPSTKSCGCRCLPGRERGILISTTTFNPIYENGVIAGLFGHLHDVTSEVLATRQLEESEARSSRILRSIGDAVIVMDAETRITHINPIAEALTGWSEARRAACR